METKVSRTSKEEAFVDACWAYKRRQRTTEPTAAEFGLIPVMAEVLNHQVQMEFERQVSRAPRKVAA